MSIHEIGGKSTRPRNMTPRKKTSHPRRRIRRRRPPVNPKTRAYGQVKGRIVSAGLRLGEVADAAGVSAASLTQHLKGERISHAAKVRIWRAFCRLSGETVGIEAFWGPLWEDAA